MDMRRPDVPSALLPEHVSVEELLDVSSDWFWCTDANFRYTFVSERIFRLTGMSAAEHIGRRFDELGASWSGGGDPFAERLPFRDRLISRVCADGRSIWIRMNGRPAYDGAGVFLGFVGTGTDVTAQVGKVDDPRQGEPWRRQLFESANVVAWAMDLDTWCFTYVSPHAERILGYPIEAWYQPNFWVDKIHPDDRENAVNFCVASTNLGEDHEFEYRMIAADGGVVWLRDIVSLVRSGGRTAGLQGFLIDISAAKNLERESARRQSMFQIAMEGLSDAFALFDPDDRLVFCNENFKKINHEHSSILKVGLPFEDMIRDNLRHGRIEEAIGREDDYFSKRMARHRSPPEEPVVHRRADGTVLLIREKKLQDSSTVLVNTDLTELSHREADLTHALEAAEEANQAKSVFLGRMSHELRTPLNAIIGFSELILSEPYGPLGAERYADYVEDVRRSGRHLLSLINDLLDLTAIETGRREIAAEVHASRALVTNALKSMRPIGQQARIRLRGEAPRHLPAVRVDARAMHQCLLNLLSNAIRAVRPGGRVLLRAEAADTGFVAFSVIDSAGSLPEQLTERLMQVGAALGASHVVETEGAGLGLAITRSLIEAMGGRLSIECERGLETRAVLTVPTV